MQKKLIAVAVAGLFSTAAFAQTTVTLGGLMDLGYFNQSLEAGGVKTKTSNFGIHNNSATSNVNIKVVEDLGGGMKATVYIETDPPFGTSTGAAFSNAPNWIELSGKFGAVSLGYINNFALTASSTSQPLGTAIGSGYSGAFGRLDGVNVLGAITVVPLGGAGVRDIRVNNAIQYKTPSFNGFSGGFQYKVKNTDAGNAAANMIGQQQIGLGYNNGPLNIAYAWSQLNAASALVAGLGLTGAPTKVTHNLLGANYSFGPATIYGGYTTSRSSGGNDALGKLSTASWNIAGKYAFTPTLAGMLNIVKVDDKSSLAGANTDADRSLVGLGLDYSMSKRTVAYFRVEDGDNDKSSATGSNAGKFTRYGLGLRHSF